MADIENAQQLRAKEKFQLGMPIAQIAREENTARSTMYEWMDKFNWMDALEEQKKKLEEQSNLKYQKIMDTQIAGAHMLYGFYLEGIKEEIESFKKDKSQHPDKLRPSIVKADDAFKAMRIAQEWVQPKVINVGFQKDVVSVLDVMSAAQEAERELQEEKKAQNGNKPIQPSNEGTSENPVQTSSQ